MFTVDQIHRILKAHKGTFPATPEGYFDPSEYRTPRYGESYWNRHGDKMMVAGVAFNPNMSPDFDPALIFKPKPKRYRFICDDPTPREPVLGEWTANGTIGHVTASKFMEVMPSDDWRGKPRLCFRREEILD